jgi:hypothetical protein
VPLLLVLFWLYELGNVFGHCIEVGIFFEGTGASRAMAAAAGLGVWKRVSLVHTLKAQDLSTYHADHRSCRGDSFLWNATCRDIRTLHVANETYASRDSADIAILDALSC